MTFQISHIEKVLVVKCIRNDRGYQKMLYDRYKDAMFTIAYRILGNLDDAADALQDGFLGVFQNLNSFKGRSTLGAWIKTIIIRTAIKKLDMQIKTEDFDSMNFDEEIIEWDENFTGSLLEKAIESLPAGYRSIFLLIEVEGYSHKETSEILNISEGTSKSQLFYAKKKLQEYLKDFKV